MAATVTEYCTLHSNDVSNNMKEVWDWTCNQFEDADQMSSPLQGATMKFLAEHQQAKRSTGILFSHSARMLTMAVLEIGCYTGYSALAWYEATEATKAEIITLELDPKMIAASRTTFDRYDLDDRITLIEGPAQESIQNLTGEFDIIFVDANKDGYEGYLKHILDQQLLAPKGFIMSGNGEWLTWSIFRARLMAVKVFARGMTISRDANPELAAKARSYWTECGKALRRFNAFCRSDPRIDTVLLPIYDGLTLIKWKQGSVHYPKLVY